MGKESTPTPEKLAEIEESRNNSDIRLGFRGAVRVDNGDPMLSEGKERLEVTKKQVENAHQEMKIEDNVEEEMYGIKGKSDQEIAERLEYYQKGMTDLAKSYIEAEEDEANSRNTYKRHYLLYTRFLEETNKEKSRREAEEKRIGKMSYRG
ncbi:MAG: hypothetical protein A3I32_01250 [Candidatus Yanofskybacteria bacterium RIFCSPLOWO2_02_FULL_45_10]|uniref:Uncharacterized protein n=2 Tax=Candidatus Yanofskyibacteriota TaxID=1752733 RepID=A0A1F8G165_9BACT|nr:MAG: hypothetical protein A3F25_01045 [Candidatus Yanofskybacteria bacterium RIFCSPHIGHO2_12_FULL_45_19b]OGN31456.1 MAG: hypothetical protein A3I32_01250 [Candidatus Yanofskybacteria bacterium RIFCSPLOWO2_02_FULL_45_10]